MNDRPFDSVFLQTHQSAVLQVSPVWLMLLPSSSISASRNAFAAAHCSVNKAADASSSEIEAMSCAKYVSVSIYVCV